MSSTPLQFISQGTAGKRPGGSDRRLIRAHVMKGKNAGRPRPSSKKATAINTNNGLSATCPKGWTTAALERFVSYHVSWTAGLRIYQTYAQMYVNI
ncbi:hypothetical protein ACEPPN_001119 [Leptodophora sp. 'Broadleaf-Isolate-01']